MDEKEIFYLFQKRIDDNYKASCDAFISLVENNRVSYKNIGVFIHDLETANQIKAVILQANNFNELDLRAEDVEKVLAIDNDVLASMVAIWELIVNRKINQVPLETQIQRDLRLMIMTMLHED